MLPHVQSPFPTLNTHKHRKMDGWNCMFNPTYLHPCKAMKNSPSPTLGRDTNAAKCIWNHMFNPSTHIHHARPWKTQLPQPPLLPINTPMMDGITCSSQVPFLQGHEITTFNWWATSDYTSNDGWLDCNLVGWVFLGGFCFVEHNYTPKWQAISSTPKLGLVGEHTSRFLNPPSRRGFENLILEISKWLERFSHQPMFLAFET